MESNTLLPPKGGADASLLVDLLDGGSWAELPGLIAVDGLGCPRIATRAARELLAPCGEEAGPASGRVARALQEAAEREISRLELRARDGDASRAVYVERIVATERGSLLAIVPEETRERLAAEVRRAGFWRLLSRLRPTLAHDLRGSLNALSLCLALAEGAGGPSSDDAPGRAGELRDELQRFAESFESVLQDLDLLREEQPREIDLVEEVRRAVDRLSGWPEPPEPRVRLRIDDDEPWTALADVRAIRQALLSLVSRALEGGPPGDPFECAVERDGARRVLSGRWGSGSRRRANATERTVRGTSLEGYGVDSEILAAAFAFRTIGATLALLGGEGPGAFAVRFPAS